MHFYNYLEENLCVLRHAFFFIFLSFAFVLPFYQLLVKKDTRYSWSPYTEVYVYKIKYYNHKKNGYIYEDVSNIGLSGSLYNQLSSNRVSLSGYGIGATQGMIESYLNFKKVCFTNSETEMVSAYIEWRGYNNEVHSKYIYSGDDNILRKWEKFC